MVTYATTAFVRNPSGIYIHTISVHTVHTTWDGVRLTFRFAMFRLVFCYVCDLVFLFLVSTLCLFVHVHLIGKIVHDKILAKVSIL